MEIIIKLFTGAGWLIGFPVVTVIGVVALYWAAVSFKNIKWRKKP